jgi:hypothetical protein
MITLEALVHPDFLNYGISSATAETLAEALRRATEVIELRKAIAIQVIDRPRVEQFVRVIVSRVELGRRSSYDVSLAALAIAFERLPGPFAADFLGDLGALNIRELPMSARIARIAQRNRSVYVPESTARVKRVANTRLRVNASPIATRVSLTETTTEVCAE